MATLTTPNPLPPLRQVERLSKKVIRILGGNPGKFTLQGTNTYLVGTGSKRLLIDTGDPTSSWTAVLSGVLAALDCVLDSVILTHRHADHTSGVNDILRHCPPETKVYKYPSSNQASDKEDPNLVLEGDRQLLHVRDGQFFSVEGATLIAVHTPGHTDDHIVLLFRRDEDSKRGKQRIDPSLEEGIFTGDSMLGHGTAVFEDLNAYWLTLHVLLGMLSHRSQAPVQQQRKHDRGHDDSQDEPVPSSKIAAYPGHGAVIDDGEARIKKYIQHRQEREAQVLAALPSRHRQQHQSQPLVQPISSPPTKRLRLESPSQDNPSAASEPSSNTAHAPPKPILNATAPVLAASVAATASFDIPKRGVSPSEIVQAVYPGLHADLQRAATSGVLMILQKLRREKRVVRFEYSHERYAWREAAGTKDEGWGDDDGGRWALR